MNVDSKEFVFNKCEIKSVKIVRFYGNFRMISEGRIIINLKNKSLKFSSDNNYDVLLMMKKYLS